MKTFNQSIKAVCFGMVMLNFALGSPAFALDAFLKTQVSTKTRPEPEISQVNIVRFDENVKPVATTISYEEVLNVEIILDASKTMSEMDSQGRTKLDIAKNIITTLVENLPKHTRFALRVNGGQYDNNCLDTALLVSFEKGNGAKVLEALQGIQPKGLTPLFYSIRDSIKDFQNLNGGKVVFVLSDGQESCDIGQTDTCAVTFERVDRARTGQVIHVIGINPPSEDAVRGLSCIAIRGHGDFLNTHTHTSEDFIRLAQKTGRLRYAIYQVFENLTEVKLLDAAIGDSPHILKPGVYRLEVSTIPPLSTYFTLDRLHNLTLGIVNSNGGLDTYDRAHLALGNWYYRNGQIQEAMAEYIKILKLDPRHADAYLNIAILMDEVIKDKAKAIELYRTYLELGGPRQAEVRQWIRRNLEVLQIPAPRVPQVPKPATKEEMLTRLRQETTERSGLSPEEQKAITLRATLLTNHPQIVSFRNEDLDKATIIGINVLPQTTDAEASNLAIQVGNQIQQELNKTPGIVIFRNNVQVVEARFSETEKRYITVPAGTSRSSPTSGPSPTGGQYPVSGQPPASRPAQTPR
jgi:tetratricopeptide (TPR) repeat protein